jgi:parallel beta-helix repeat protein
MHARRKWFFALLLVSPQLIFAQGSLTPPAAPAPTMRTLDQVEPRGMIAQPISPASLPITIGTPGSYYLTSNIIAPAGYTGNGIIVNASRVTIDLNGFEVAGVSGSGAGVFIGGSQTDITVRNGNIFSWGAHGIDGIGNGRIYVDSVRSMFNSGLGFNLDLGALITNCIASNNVGIGIHGAAGSVVRNCVSQNNNSTGIDVGSGSVVQGSTSRNNLSSGIKIGDGGSIDNCVVYNSGNTSTPNIDGIVVTQNCSVHATASSSNTGWGLSFVSSPTGNGTAITNSTFASNKVGGINANAGSLITNCTVINNGSNTNTIGVQLTAGCFITGCSVSNNQGTGIYAQSVSNRIAGNLVTSNSGDGIYTQGNTNMVDGNFVINNTGSGISLQGAGNLMMRNIAHGGSTYFVGPGNFYATGLTATASFSNTDPTVNITY